MKSLGALSLVALTVCSGGGGSDTTQPPDNSDAVTQSVGPAGATVVTPSGAAGVQIPAGTFSQPVAVTVSRIEVSTAPGSGPLPTSLKQYGPFYELTTNPPVLQFSNDARVGICQVTNPSSPYYPPEPHALLRLAHKVGNDVEVLEPVSVNDFLVCGNVLPIRESSHTSSRFLARLESIAGHVTGFFKPAQVYAAHGGLGGKVKSFSPFGAVQIELSFTNVSAGDGFTCAINSDGKAYCWGGNADGRLGVGSTTIGSSDRPLAVASTELFDEVSAGRGYACALSRLAQTFCWGKNDFGQVGNGTTATVTAPVSIMPARRLSTGLGDHACGLSSPETRAFCWGRNSAGQLGIGSIDQSAHPAPQAVVIQQGNFPTTWSDISVGLMHTCGISGNQVYCWGLNDDGRVGDGTMITRTVPTQVAGGLSFAKVTVGILYACGLTTAGSAYCWGQNGSGQLGTGSTGPFQLAPVPVSGGRTFASISSGGNFTCALTVDGSAYCWGQNQFGQLGDGSTTDRFTPTLVSGGLGFESLSVGSIHTCGRTKVLGIVYCWGNNAGGQLGNGTRTDSSVPVKVANQKN
jgi:alpha-tubulin suppressor-like RCC1 family protein